MYLRYWMHNRESREKRKSMEEGTGNNGLAQELISGIKGERRILPGIPELIREGAADGCVLLKNDGVLPLQKGRPVSVFGRCQVDTFYVGYGSGGDVHPPYRVSYLEGLRDNPEITLNEELAAVYECWCKENPPVISNLWGQWPMCYPEMALTKELTEAAAKQSDTALVILGRAAGEERENLLKEGSYYLTKAEEAMLELVTSCFTKTIVIMNCGNIIDMSWLRRYPVQGLVLAWLGGMEAGHALADVLSGAVNPSGRLTDTIAESYEAYPSAGNFGAPGVNCYEEDIYVGYRYFETFDRSRVLFPFGYGLSYTEFEMEAEGLTLIEPAGADYPEAVGLTVHVTNTGACPGRQVVQLYLSAPQAKLGKAARSLVAFAKTGLLAPGETETLSLTVPATLLASYDDTGKTPFRSAFVMEEGRYAFYLGANVAEARKVAGFCQKKTAVLEQLEPVCCPEEPFMRLVPAGEPGENGQYAAARETVPAGGRDLKKRILERLPQDLTGTGERSISFAEVCAGAASMEEFVAQLTEEELEALTRGEGGMNSSLGTEGNTGIFGGTIPSLRDRGIPPMVTADGPAGLRLKRYTSLIPCGTVLACTWDTELVEQLFRKIGEETKLQEIDVILSPGLNIHRNPLCGRNFEYYSEDPLISGKMAAAAVRGIQSRGVSACPKHFAGNNQEEKRNQTDDRVSERALREIYFRGFELCVKEGKPQNLMASYNKINGVWSHYNYDLTTTVLREEWHYEGNVMTDWWMQLSASPEFPFLRDNAYRVRAQVDVLMPGDHRNGVSDYRSDGTLLESRFVEQGITRGELERSAKNVLRFIKWRFCH